MIEVRKEKQPRAYKISLKIATYRIHPMAEKMVLIFHQRIRKSELVPPIPIQKKEEINDINDPFYAQNT